MSVKPIGLFDMDGTLFDYVGTLRNDLLKLMSPEEVECEDIFTETKPYLKERIKLIKSQVGWWKNLPALKAGWDVYHIARELDFKCKILTKGPYKNPQAWAEKVQCIEKHFDESVSIDIVGEDKSSNYGRFLCDDYIPYMEGWLEHRRRGLGILIGNNKNKDFTHPNVIRYDSEADLPAIVAAMTAVRNRKPCEHWK